MAENQINEVESSSMKTDSTVELSQFLKHVEPVQEAAHVEQPVEEETELDKAIRAKKNEQKGLVVNTTDLKDDNGPKQFKSAIENEERETEFSTKSNELDDLAARAKRVHLKRKPQHQIESAEMMDEISILIDNGDGTLSLPEGYNAKYVVPFTKEEVEDLLSGKKVKPLNGSPASKTETEKEDSTDDAETDGETKDDEEETDDAYKDAIVKILIDKTGFGTDNIEFTEEEKRYLEKSSEIQLVEVESRELETIITNKTDVTLDSYLGTVDKYQFSTSKTGVVFTGSGFKADMLGLSYAEFTDIALDISEDSEDVYDFDKMYKKLSVIYNKMANLSCGKFETFDDFLHNFAQIDVPLATFGLVISSQPEEDEINLKCQAEGCKKGFTHKYMRRSVIDFEHASIDYLEEVKKITNAKPEEYGNLQKNSLVNRRKAIKLPVSNVIVEIGLASCYEYLYDTISIYKKLKNDPNASDNEMLMLVLLTTVRSISIPTENGKYVKFVKAEDIIKILSEKVPPMDIRLLWNINVEVTEKYEIPFTIRNIVCPHCQAKTERMVMTPDEMVFFDLQHMLSTPLTIKTTLNF